jgi:phage tail sheath protein FI
MILLDSPSGWDSKANAKTGVQTGIGTKSKNAAIFFPRFKQPNPLRDNQVEVFVPCGAVAGVFARNDSARGVWKAPAGIEATLRGVPELTVNLTDAENGELNPLGLNCMRTFPIIGRVIWGSRTLQGADLLASEWKYVPVRRLTLFIEESLYRGTQWVVFEPNDEPLWAQIRLNVGAFMHNLFRQGAFQGSTPNDAYFVHCDKNTTTQNDIDLGIVNIEVGFAPLKPAEFVIIKIQQIAGQLEI